MEAIVLGPLISQLSASCLCPPRNYFRASVQHAHHPQFLKLSCSHHGGAWFGSQKSCAKKLRRSHDEEGSYGSYGGGAIAISPLSLQLSASSCLCAPPRNHSRASVQHAHHPKFLKFSSHHGGAWFGSSKSCARKFRWSHHGERIYGSYGGGGAACRCNATADSTHYSVLGVDKDTSLWEIKAAYRQMARKYHPDVCPVSLRDECTQKFLQVQNAYEVLSDPELKADYDYHLLHPLFAKAFEMGVGDSRGRASRRARGYNGVSEAWKMRWEAQLSQLTRLRDRDARGPVEKTWGERMRQAQGT